MEWSEFEQARLLTMRGTEAADSNLNASRLDTAIWGYGGNDRLTGKDGHDSLYGGVGDDTLSGGNGNDLLDGGAGSDTLNGGAGNDTYVFGRGYGNDTVSAYDTVIDKRDVIRLVGLALDDVEFLTLPGYPSNLVIRIKDSGETLTISGAISSNATGHNSYGIQAIEFGDGTVMEWSEFEQARLLTMRGTEAADSNLNASRLDTAIWGYGGNDRLTGKDGHDVLYGGIGDDTLSGGNGHDTLVGGTGNDYLEGGAGNDTYIFGSGDGQDTINNYGGGSDLLKFEDIDPAELWFGKNGNHLVIGLIGGSDQVTVNNWYASSSYQIATIQTDSEALMATQVNQLVQAMAAVGAPGGAGGQWTEEQRDALAPVLASYWQPRV